jgi:hypothetical protein
VTPCPAASTIPDGQGSASISGGNRRSGQPPGRPLATQPGTAQAYVFVAFAALLAAAIPLIVVLPDHRGAW